MSWASWVGTNISDVKISQVHYLQRTFSMVKYGQVNQLAAIQTRPAGTVNPITHHHQILRSRTRLTSRRKKNKYANLTGKIMSHQRVVAASFSLEVLGISSRRLNSKPLSAPWSITARESYKLWILLYARPVAAHKQTTAKRSKTSSVENCLTIRARM